MFSFAKTAREYMFINIIDPGLVMFSGFSQHYYIGEYSFMGACDEQERLLVRVFCIIFWL